MKYYAVKVGRCPGIYLTWNEAKEQVSGFKGAVHKSFPTRDEADTYLHGGVVPKTKINAKKLMHQIKYPSISVDAACSGNPGTLEYRCVDNLTNEVIFLKGPFPKGTNNIGEYLAIVEGLSFIKESGLDLYLYTDSLTGLAWVKRGKCNTTLNLVDSSDLSKAVLKADKIAQSLYSIYKGRIIKWDTKVLGEIPADFGRK